MFKDTHKGRPWFGTGFKKMSKTSHGHTMYFIHPNAILLKQSQCFYRVTFTSIQPNSNFQPTVFVQNLWKISSYISSCIDARRNWLQKTDNWIGDSVTSLRVRSVDVTAQFVQKPAHNNIMHAQSKAPSGSKAPTQSQNNRQILKAMRWRHLPEPYLCTALPLSRLQVWQMREKKQNKYEGKST